MLFKKSVFLAVLLSCIVGSASCTPITIGNLSSNDDWSTDVISDSSRGIEYVRLDKNRGLIYSQTLALIEKGGKYEGWHIAREASAKLFIDALLGRHTCMASPYFSFCSGTNLMSAVQYSQLTGGYIYDRFGMTGFAYLTDYPAEPTYKIGVFRANPRTDPVVRFDVGPATTVSNHDFAVWYYHTSLPFLLYRPTPQATVDEPSSVLLFAIALFGVAGVGCTKRRPRNTY